MKNGRRNNVILLAASYLLAMAQKDDKRQRLNTEELKQEPDKFVLTNPYSELGPLSYQSVIRTKKRKGGNNRKEHKRKKAKNGRK